MRCYSKLIIDIAKTKINKEKKRKNGKQKKDNNNARKKNNANGVNNHDNIFLWRKIKM